MAYHHSNVYVVRIVDTDNTGEQRTWFAGPYGSTRADQTARYLEFAVCDESVEADLSDRLCYVEPLYSDNECLRVDDYTRATDGSLV